MAEGITKTGQVVIRWMERKMNEKLNLIMKTESVDYVIASDTDSCVYDTKIHINDEVDEIGKVYEKYCNNDNLIHQRDNNDYIHNVSDLNIYTKSFDNNAIVNDKIISIMKHRVKKQLYRITINDSEVIVTENHSIMIERAGKLIEVKPNEITENDIFINISDTDSSGYERVKYVKTWAKDRKTEKS